MNNSVAPLFLCPDYETGVYDIINLHKRTKEELHLRKFMCKNNKGYDIIIN